MNNRGLGVVKGEAKVLLSFVASQTMIYIVLLLRYSTAKKALPFPLKKRKKLSKIRLFCYCSKMVNYSKFSPSFHLQDKTTIAKILFTNLTKMRVKIHHISRACLTFIYLLYSFIRVEILHSSPMAIHHIITTCLMSKIFIPYKL